MVPAVLFAAEPDVSWGWNALSLLSIPALVVLNAFFVAAEFALVGVRRTRVEQMVLQGVKGARAVESAVAHLTRYIAATQLGITLSSIGLGYVGEPALASLLHPLFEYFPHFWGLVATHSLATFFTFLLITFLLVVFGELLPKTLAIQVPDRTALLVARPLIIFERLTRPLIVIINGTGTFLIRLCGFASPTSESMVHSVEELLMLIEDTEEAGMLDAEQAEYAQNVFRLSNKRVRDCMVPREKMHTLELNSPPDKILEAVRQGAWTRMPVYEGELDNIVGIVNTKDLFYLFSLRGVVVLEDALYPPLFVKPDDPMVQVLSLFRRSHRPMALVRGADNKILGLITLEDVLEEIVGDIEDEHDRPIPKLRLKRRGPKAGGTK
jgi:CBS domain containing-hemolysin-like protein